MPQIVLNGINILMFSMNKTVYYRTFLVILILVNGCGNPKDIVTANPLPDWWGNRKITESKIYNLQLPPALVIEYYYFVDNDRYEGAWIPPPSDYSYSYKKNYEVAYNPDNPDEHFLLIHKPIYNCEELQELTITGKSTDISFDLPFKKERTELKIERIGMEPSFGVNSVHKSKRFGSVWFYVEYFDTLLYFQKEEHDVYLMRYMKNDPMVSKLYLDYPLGIEKYSWTRFMSGEVNGSILKKIQKKSRQFIKKLGDKGAIYYYINAYGNVNKQEQKKSFDKLKNFTPKDRKGNDLDVDIHIVTDSLIKSYYDEYTDFLENQKNRRINKSFETSKH